MGGGDGRGEPNALNVDRCVRSSFRRPVIGLRTLVSRPSLHVSSYGTRITVLTQDNCIRSSSEISLHMWLRLWGARGSWRSDAVAGRYTRGRNKGAGLVGEGKTKTHMEHQTSVIGANWKEDL